MYFWHLKHKVLKQNSYNINHYSSNDSYQDIFCASYYTAQIDDYNFCFISYSIYLFKGKQTSPKHRVGSPNTKLFNFSIESSYEEKEEEIFLNMEKENAPDIPIVKICFEDSKTDIVNFNGNPKLIKNEESIESKIIKENSVELIEFNSIDNSTKITTPNHENDDKETIKVQINGNHVNDIKVELDSCDTSFQQPFQTIDTLNEIKHKENFSKLEENTLGNDFHSPKENHDNFSVIGETTHETKVDTNGHTNGNNHEDNHDNSIDTLEQLSIDDISDPNCADLGTALVIRRKKTAEARRNFFRESKNIHENGLNFME